MLEKGREGVPVNFIETLMSEKLLEKNPLIDVLAADRKVLQIACQDLINYLKIHWDLVGKEANECEIAERIEKIFDEDPKELEEFLSVWTGIWLKKWGERVKLLIGSENSKRWNNMTRILNNAEPIWTRLPNRREMEDVVVSTLIKNGEICGTSILAENLLKMELGDDKKKYADDKEQVINVVSNALRKARELIQSRGPLIFVKVDKGYYEST
ncbi:MAG TPA: hypothetical protein VMT06_01120 [Candidatus Eisenbacteria bacterium]|nr:hypothetical protein [Candidatus Eisenbacteria bacterium]